MTSIQQSLHSGTAIRIWPLIAILAMHILLLLALSQHNTRQTDNAAKGTDLTFLTSVAKQTYPLIPKTEQEKPALQKLPLTPPKETPLPAKKSATTSPASADKLPASQAAEKSRTDITTSIEAGVEADASAKSSISLAQLRSQATVLARESAQSGASESGNQGILGDYYGSYQGADTGTFYIHVNHQGNILGNADSRTAHSSFTITGKVSTDGVVQMTGKGLAGSASFDGKINLATGAVSGHWNLTGFGKGQFSGQRAKAVGSRAY
ncbi:hypothetical protein [Undibacterium pigrum]|uniref:Uncharacterized protein n=1 Tax=Undibacterium pigrum TaxID=401470 RepID=A0A318JFV6_9BURK|nr:hypothetical protein [Undibacterium pigrum]PXX42567.1 hypothetical protein DFR42_105225 [Undibacterium pigrum]